MGVDPVACGAFLERDDVETAAAGYSTSSTLASWRSLAARTLELGALSDSI
jgi:hypothetical protein